MGLYDKVEDIEPMRKLPKFEYGQEYEVRLSRPIEIAKDIFVRPSANRIVLSGDKAEEFRDAIIWAKKKV